MITLEEFQKVELTIGEIKEVSEHPNADKLYVLKVDLGGDVRQLVAGVRLAYPNKEELIGKKIVVVKNLQPAVIRGIESQGMMLAASGEGALAIIHPGKDIPLGSVVR